MLGIKGKIVVVITFVALSSSIVIGWTSISKSRQVLQIAATNNMIFQSEVVCSHFESELDRISSSAIFLETMLKTEIPEDYSNPESFNLFVELLERQMREYAAASQLISLWAVFDPGFAPGNQMVSLYDQNRDGVFEKERPYNVFEQDLSSPTMDWWNKAISNGSHWSLPYYWENWQMELVSFSKAVYHDGRLVGCVGSDLNYSELKERMSSFKAYKTGFFALFDGDYNLIFHPLVKDVGVQLGNIISSDEFKRFEGHTRDLEKGAFEFDLNGNERLLSFRHLSNGWLMVAYVNKDEVLLPAYEHGRSILVILAIVVALAILLSIVLAHSITTPILKIIDCFRAAADGKLETRIAARTHDELDYLTGSFNQFMEKIQQLISDLKVQEENLFRATAKAEESDRLKTQFLGNISHELRTPLYAIVGFSQLLDDPDLDNDTRRLYISRINLNNDRLLSFVEDIMTFSKLELSQLTVSNEIFQLEELLEEIESHYNNFFAVQPKPLELIVRKRFAGYGLEICSDRSLLKKIITVLLDNAYKFSNGGAVTLSYVVADSFYRIYVKDAGVGIPLQYQKLIFNKFYQYQPNDKVVYGGSGLGLALAKGIAVLLGGVINVRSVVGKGSVFCVTFPR